MHITRRNDREQQEQATLEQQMDGWIDHEDEGAAAAATPKNAAAEDRKKSKNESNPSSMRGISTKVAKFIARHPLRMILGTIGIVIMVSILCLFLSDFELSEENKKGWKSRGTDISMRGMQADVIRDNTEALFNDTTGDLWTKLTTQVSMGNFEISEQLSKTFILPQAAPNSTTTPARLPLEEGCDVSWYSSREVFDANNMMALWKAKETSLLEPEVVEAMCIAEEGTMSVLREKNLCGGCSNGDRCLPPLSLSLVLRNYLDGGGDMSCSDIRQAYQSVQDVFTTDLILCANELKANSGDFGENSTCPLGFTAPFVDAEFGVDGSTFLRYSSSFFHTSESDPFELFQESKSFGYGSDNLLKVTYDTRSQNFRNFSIDEVVMFDLIIAAASGCMVCIAIAIHTGSIWLLCMGLMQITFAIPLSYAVYRFVFGIRFFSLLNFIGLFVSAALGADDLFVATDKWKNARLQHPTQSTEEVAAEALPEAAFAMLLTTSTTSVAFFATCVSPVAPIFTFAVFCGLMVIFNYVLNCTLVFPALCMYDRWIMNGSTSWFVTLPSSKVFCKWKGGSNDIVQGGKDIATRDSDISKYRPIQKRMEIYYGLLHRGRWGVLFIGAVLLGVTSYYAQTISLPNDIFVQLLPDSHPLVQHSFILRKKLLSSFLLDLTTGTSLGVYFGVSAQDTGDRNNPDTLSTLELDGNFDPSTNEAQTYLLDFCDRFFEKPFAYKSSRDYSCSVNRFDEWLGVQSLLPLEDKAPEYNNICKGAGSMPMPEKDFHSCFIYWSKLESDTGVLHWDGKVRILIVHGGTRGRVVMPLEEILNEWELFEAFQEDDLQRAPIEASFFHSSSLWWAADTFTVMQSTGLSSLYISIAFAALVVFISSGSFVCSFISALSIYFILVTAIATLVGLGWELGFLEWVCFAILVGISADFVIHLSNSYCQLSGHCSKEERTRYALMSMGPSILGAALTTFTVAFMMLFCEVIFFVKFAQMLIVTILYALVGACVFYAVIVDIVGPAKPTQTVDRILLCVSNKRRDTT